MSISHSNLGTGLSGLDNVLKGLLPGDNVVFQLDDIDLYPLFVAPYAKSAVQNGKILVYFRFAEHPPLITDDYGAKTVNLDPSDGFEKFIQIVHNEIKSNGRGACYIFDSLSELSEEWYSDQALANFFTLTCPYLLDIEALAYFAIQKYRHSSYAVAPILDTTQIFIDVRKYKNNIYIHPIKVQRRFSPTMYMLHRWENDKFIPITDSSNNAEILNSAPLLGQESADKDFDIWNKTFAYAKELSKKGGDKKETDKIKSRLLKMAFVRDGKLYDLADKYFTLEELIEVGRRIIGTGLIGGKTLGMLLARAILNKSDTRWDNILEVHDSFYIGSDVFYTFLVRNGCWWIRQQQSNLDILLQNAELARRQIHRGTFPDHIIKKFSDLLNYFGQSPILVRSSSLLEDSYGNAFSGKYESIFCANQGPHEKRLEDFIRAIKDIYASALSERALRYRARCGLLDKDEQMSLLVQRVSGNLYSSLFYPSVAGVAYSFNPYVWHKTIDPAAGVMRIVFGMGTRAVDRLDDDYTRIVALNAPERIPDNDPGIVQRKADVINLEANQLVALSFETVCERSINPPIANLVSYENGRMRLDFMGLIGKTDFVSNMRDILSALQKAYDFPVDIEFTLNFVSEREYKINIVQCRPFQAKTDYNTVIKLPKLEEKNIILKSKGNIIGQTRYQTLDRIIIVNPQKYSSLALRERYETARIIGRINALQRDNTINTLLIGPGRWGTSTPFMGVPVSFSEISSFSAICEFIISGSDFVPDISLGTHFFNDLVEANILYFALFDKKDGAFLNTDLLKKFGNALPELLPQDKSFAETISVIDIPNGNISIYADTLEQQILCFFEKNTRKENI
jgi:hypothetical protein